MTFPTTQVQLLRHRDYHGLQGNLTNPNNAPHPTPFAFGSGVGGC